MEKLIIRKPDDWHLHLREGVVLKNILRFSSDVFGRAIIMPNTKNPITTIEKGVAYKNAICSLLQKTNTFKPLMTVYLTDSISNDEIKRGFLENIFFAAKLYPANATTNSLYGVKNIKKIYKVFELMQEIGMPLLIHGEVSDSKVDIFDREEVFIDTELDPLIKNFPNLKIVLEHITTSYAVDFVENNNIAATITPHHLHINRNAMFFGGLNSDFYCLPVAKRESNRISLIKAATSGKECFFLGTDSAPHLREWKAFCGCAGIFNSPVALNSYLQIFEEENSLENFEKFASINGPKFHNLPLNNENITLIRDPYEVEEFVDIFDGNKKIGAIKPFHAGKILNWRTEVNITNSQ